MAMATAIAASRRGPVRMDSTISCSSLPVPVGRDQLGTLDPKRRHHRQGDRNSGPSREKIGPRVGDAEDDGAREPRRNSACAKGEIIRMRLADVTTYVATM